MSTEQNKTIARQFFMEQDKRKGPLSPDIVAAGYVARIGSNPPMDMAGHSGFGAAFYQGFPDLYHTIDDVIAEGDKVVVRFTVRGAQTGDFMGIPATGRAIEVSATAMMTFVDGKVAQLTAQFDQLGMMQQLGVIPGS
ncbi:MAG: ester cyclase [Caldilineaceae bacterium]|nr:ester cyclase [Caldilineaceae bacterium]